MKDTKNFELGHHPPYNPPQNNVANTQINTNTNYQFPGNFTPNPPRTKKANAFGTNNLTPNIMPFKLYHYKKTKVINLIYI